MTKNQYLPDTISITLASPEQIRSWSFGEILRPETINYRTGRSERGGLFDERVFGPERDYQCYCGKYRGIRYKGITCEKCGVEITRAIVRRERMGHIELASPVAHIWYLRGIPSRIGLLLDIAISELEKVVYFAGYIVMSVNDSERARALRDLEHEYKSKVKTLQSDEEIEQLQKRYTETKTEMNSLRPLLVLNETQYYTFSIKYSTLFEASIGAEAIFEIAKRLDLNAIADDLTVALEKSSGAIRDKVIRRLNLVRQMLVASVRPDWMFISVIPVIPPALRPMVALEGGRFATSDLNDLYRRVINRNNRLKKLMEIGAPEVILRNEKRILQEAVDALFDNSMKRAGGSGGAVSVGAQRQLKSLADNLKAKQGLFRQNLLGKRVDYSGRSVIVVGPNLKINQCGLPKYMALELFRPFVIGELMKRELAFNVRGANRLIEEGTAEVWEILEHVITGKYVLLNRAPTLHRLSIQAFYPVLIEGKAIQVHPLVCAAFNADFDGDQMAVHVPLSKEAQREAHLLVAANTNILRPQTGTPIASPSQDIVLGVFWMTKEVPGSLGEGLVFGSLDEAVIAREHGHLDYRAKIKMLVDTSLPKFAQFTDTLIETTLGRMLFNEKLPIELPYVNTAVKKKDLEKIVSDIITAHGVDVTSLYLDEIKAFGYRYVTISGTTFSMDEVQVPEAKKDIIARADARVAEINGQFADGLISDDERYRMTVEVWETATGEMSKALDADLEQSQSTFDMIKSGARGSLAQLNQSAGMKGVIQNAIGQALDFPIRSNFKEGFSPLEYFINTTTARKGLADTALNTAKAGYLTRRLHDVAQDVVVAIDDCGTKKGLWATRESIDGIERSLADNLYGRVLAENVKDSSGTLLYSRGTLVTKIISQKIQSMNVEKVLVRTPITCESRHGICRDCYGLDLGRNIMVRIGEAVGTVAAQAIGEPGTQLTLRTFHSGGVVGRDITQGLPRVEELFERRKPKALAVITEVPGEVTGIETSSGVTTIIVTTSSENRSVKGSKSVSYEVPYRRIPVVKIGTVVEAGDLLTDGSVDPLHLFDIAGREKAQEYLISEISKVYELQSAAVARKHLEIIVRQMFSRARVTDPGDTLLVPGAIITMAEIEDENSRVRGENGVEANFEPMLLGVAEAALQSPSWLSAASFQHTQRVLTSAAVRGATDYLRGLKENVILGNLIPAGTGFNDNYIYMDDLVSEEPVTLSESDSDL